jgi:hypothetical protein
MPDIIAYCDESATEHQVYCVAGYWAESDEWTKLGNAWSVALADEGLAEFHARDCAHGRGHFKGRPRGDRDRVHARFIELISSSQVSGVFAAIDLGGWEAVKLVVDELRAPDGMADPYYVVFQTLVERICRGLSDRPDGESLHLVFDDRRDHGKVVNLYQSLRHADELELAFVAKRLGGVSFGNSHQIPQLQVADLLAYEIKKRFEPADHQPVAIPMGHSLVAGRKTRWQLQRLVARPINGDHFPPEKVLELVEVMERRFRSGADALKTAQAERRAERAKRGEARRRD